MVREARRAKGKKGTKDSIEGTIEISNRGTRVDVCGIKGVSPEKAE